MASKYKNKRMLGQDADDDNMYRFNDKNQMDPTDAKVSKDIDDRDVKDIDKGKSPDASKADKQSAKEAVERQNLMGAAYEGTNKDTGKGFSKGKRSSTANRLKTLYGNSGS